MQSTPRSTSDGGGKYKTEAADIRFAGSPDVSVVVPVFEEDQSLKELSEAIRSALEAKDFSFEVLLIDDGSKDKSWAVIEELNRSDARFLGIRFKRNYGKSAAIAVGFEHARGAYIVTMDADLQDDPTEIPEMIKILENGADLVSGWKKHRKDPLSKTIPSKFFNAVTRKISGIPLHDFNCGLKAYRSEVVKSVHVYGELHRYIPLLAKWEGFNSISEKTVEHHERKFGRTKFGIERYLRGFLDLITVIFITRWAVRPMHFFGMFGTLSFLLGFIINLWISIEKIVFGIPIGDRPLLLLGALLILLGAQLFSVGLLGEMIIKDKMETTSSYQITQTTEPERIQLITAGT